MPDNSAMDTTKADRLLAERFGVRVGDDGRWYAKYANLRSTRRTSRLRVWE